MSAAPLQGSPHTTVPGLFSDVDFFLSDSDSTEQAVCAGERFSEEEQEAAAAAAEEHGRSCRGA